MSVSKPSRFLITTDYRSLKRGEGETTRFDLPGSTVIAGSSSYTATKDVVLGEQGSLHQTAIASFENGRGWNFYSSINFAFTGTNSGSPATYNVLCTVTRVAPTVVRHTILIVNPYATALTTQPNDDSFLFSVFPLVAPYE